MSSVENIVLLVVDSLRKKDIQEDSEIAPYLTSKAEEGVYLEKYYSTAAWTGPAHASMFSGKMPSEHGFTTENTYFEDENILLKEMSDFYSLGLSEIAMASPITGLDKGFNEFIHLNEKSLGGDVWQYIWKNESEFDSRMDKWKYFARECVKNKDISSMKRLFEYIGEKKLSSGGADFNSCDTLELFTYARQELEKERDSFVFMNIFPVHHPYTFDTEDIHAEADFGRIKWCSQSFNHEDYLWRDVNLSKKDLELRKESYRASIRYADRKIEEFVNECPESTVFVVLGDHGELFGEFEWEGSPIIGHQFGTFKELIEVPCFLFSNTEDIPDTNEQELYDHRDIPDIISKIVNDKGKIEGNGIARSEFFGRSALFDQFDEDKSIFPEEFVDLYDRKSFSLINNEFKFDLTTQGEYLWLSQSLTEENQIKGAPPSALKSKADIFYGNSIFEN